MKKAIATLYFLGLTTVSFAQKDLKVRYIVDTDTILATGRVITNMFDKNDIWEISFIKKLTLRDTVGFKSIKPSNIKFLDFTDFKNNKRTFVSSNLLPQLQIENSLLEKKFVGKISWYKYYYGSLINGTQTTVNYFVNENGKSVKGEGQVNIRKRLPLIIDNSDEVQAKIDSIKGVMLDELDIKIFEFLEFYNKINKN